MTHSDTPSQRTWRTLVGATLVSVLVFFGATAGAQTTDDPEAGGDTDQGSVDTGSEIGRIGTAQRTSSLCPCGGVASASTTCCGVMSGLLAVSRNR